MVLHLFSSLDFGTGSSKTLKDKSPRVQKEESNKQL